MVVKRLGIIRILATLLALLGCEKDAPSAAESLEGVRSRVTIEQAYEFGTEMELLVKKGDIVRLTLNENLSGRKEMFLLATDDMLQLRVPSRWRAERASVVTRYYDLFKDYFREMGSGTALNLRVSEGPDNKVTIKLLVDEEKKLRPRRLKQAREKGQKREEERREANVISVDERLAAFVRLWSEVKYNFAFFDQVPDLNWDKVLDEYLPKVREEQTTDEYYRLLEQCVARLKDGHTTVDPPSILRGRARLPVRLAISERKPIISEVPEAAAFWQPALKPGLEITHIDGRPVAEILQQDVYPYIADSTPQNRDRWAFRRLIEGEEGSEAVVRLRSADGEVRELKLTRLEWVFPTPPPRFEYYDLGEGVAYVALNSFSRDEVASLFGAAFDKIRRAKGLIIDVRDNGGGSTRHGNAIISHLIAKPLPGSPWKTRKYMPAFRAWGRKEAWHEGEGSTIRPKAKNPYLGPLVVLIGPGTVSAAEDFVVALHASGRATLVGEKTAGTTGQPLYIKLPRGGRARICTKRDTYPDGREFVGIGVIPDVEVHPTQDSIAEGRDAVLEKAVEVLARRAGIPKIDPAVLAAEFVSQRRPKPTAGKGQGNLIEILEKAKAEYNALVAAYSGKDWASLYSHGGNLFLLLFDEVLPAFEVEFHRELVKAEGRLNQQTEYELLKAERLRKEIEAFFPDGTDLKEVHRLMDEVADLSDEVSDCARDQLYGEIPNVFPELEKRWGLLRSHINRE